MGSILLSWLKKEATWKILPDTGYDILVACAFITIALNPILFQLFKPFTQEESQPPQKNRGDLADTIFYEPQSTPESFLPKAVVVGYGIVGKILFSDYSKKLFQVTIVDRNIDLVSAMKERQFTMVYGDATQLQLLEQANLENAQTNCGYNTRSS